MVATQASAHARASTFASGANSETLGGAAINAKLNIFMLFR